MTMSESPNMVPDGDGVTRDTHVDLTDLGDRANGTGKAGGHVDTGNGNGQGYTPIRIAGPSRSPRTGRKGGLPDDDPPVVATVRLEPSARIFEVFRNAGYELPAAIADLVDNSIDAGAKNILVRFIRTANSLQGLQVIDDGRGMTEDEATEAMRFGSEKSYDEDALGMFGVGLKSASLSCADGLTVVSRTRRNGTVARRWTAAGAAADWTCEILDPQWAKERLRGLDAPVVDYSRSGTLVQWDDVHDFGRATNTGVDRYLKRRFREIHQHLGLHFHRIIERGETTIFIDSFNIDSDQRGPISEVEALDPFGYPKTGKRGYPKLFRLTDEDCGELELTAHIWPKGSKLDEYRLDGVANRQGLYFYCNNRLLHGGGWCNLREDAEPHLSLARVAVDLPRSWQSAIRIRFNKSGVEAPSSFADALLAARSVRDDRPFSTFIDDATAVYRHSDNAAPTLKAVLPPGRGIPSAVQKEIGNHFPLQTSAPLEIIWEDLPESRFFRIDRDPRRPALKINKKFRRAILANRPATGTDAPVLKTLLYLLFQEHCSKMRVTGKDQAFLNTLNRILVRAAGSE